MEIRPTKSKSREHTVVLGVSSGRKRDQLEKNKHEEYRSHIIQKQGLAAGNNDSQARR